MPTIRIIGGICAGETRNVHAARHGMTFQMVAEVQLRIDASAADPLPPLRTGQYRMMQLVNADFQSRWFAAPADWSIAAAYDAMWDMYAKCHEIIRETRPPEGDPVGQPRY